MTGCEEKYVNGFVGWYRGKSVSVIPFYFEDSDWSFEEMAGPYNPPDSNSWFLTCDFKKNFYTDTTVKLVCKILPDNQGPEVFLDIQKPYVNTFYASDEDFDFSFYVGDDKCDVKNEIGSGIKSVTFELDGDKKFIPIDIAGNKVSVHVEKEGEHYFSIDARDKVGNLSQKSERIIIDKTCPLINVRHNIARENSWYNSKVVIECDAADMLSGVNESSWVCSVLENVSGKKNFYSDSSLALMEDGLYSIEFSVEDNCKNKTTTDKIQVCIDRTNPSLVLPESIVSSNYLLSDELTVIAEDNLSGVDFNRTILEVDERKVELGMKISGLNNGWHKLTGVVYDNAQNKSDFDSVSFFVDTVPPVIKEMPAYSNVNILKIECFDNESGIDEQKIFHKVNGSQEWESGDTVELCEGYSDVSWMVYDKAGNRQIYSSKILIDTHGPKISYEINEYYNSSFITLERFTVNDEYSEKLEMSYSFDGGVIRKFPESFTLNNCIELNGIRDGLHSISVYASDDHGNNSVVTKTFTLDRVPPELQLVNIKSNGKQLVNGERILRSNNPGVDLLSLVISLNGRDECSGIKNYCLYLNDKKYEIYDSEIELQDFEDGINALNVCCLDKAGNISKSEKYWFYADNSKPNAPEIISSEFRYATDFDSADNVKSGFFVVRPINQVDCSVIGISYSLYTLSDSGEKEYLLKDNYLENNGEIKIEIKNLEDNLVNQMYCLSCLSVGENYLKSDESTYYFRVDTTAPDDFSVVLKNFVSNENWINTDSPYVKWKVGFDATGFDRIEYCALEQNSSKSELEKVEWNRIPLAKTEGSHRINIPFGKTAVYFRAYDKVGNFIQKELNLNVDLEVPEFISDDLQCNWAHEKITGRKDNLKISWPKVLDKDSGVDFIKVVLSAFDESNNNDIRKEYLLKNSKKDCTIRNIDECINYLIEIFVYDKAGNSVSRSVFCRSKTCDNNLIEYKLSENFGDIKFEGDAIYDFNVNSISLRNGAFIFKQDFFHENNKKVDSIECDPLSAVFFENVLNFCSSVDGFYSFIIEDTEFKFTKLVADKTDGVNFNNLTYHQSFFDNDKFIDSVLKFNFSGINDFYLNTDKTYFERSAVKFPSCILDNISSIYIKDNQKKYGDNTNIIFKDVTRLVPHENTLGITCFDATSCLSDEEFYCQIKSRNCDLVVSDNLKLNIVESYVSSNYLEVHESDFIFYDDNNSSVRVVIGNYSINLETGKIESSGLKTNFYDSFGNEITNIKINGFVIKQSDVYFNESDVLSCKINFDCCYGNLNVSNIEITSTGLDFRSSAFPGFEFNIHGIHGICNKSMLEKEDAKISVKVIDGYLNLFSKNVSVSGIVLDPYSDGHLICDYSSGNLEEEIVCGRFGNSITVTDLTITNDHVYADINVPLKDNNFGISFYSVVIDNEKIFCEINNQVFKWKDYELTCGKIQFDGNEIYLISGFLKLINTDHVIFSKDKIRFEKIIINFDDVVAYELSDLESNLRVLIDGFDLEIINLKINCNGLVTELSGLHNLDDLQLEISLNDVCFDGNLNISSGGEKIDESMSYVKMSEHRLYLPDCKFIFCNEKYVLSCDFPYLTGWDPNDDIIQIELGKINIDSLGNIENTLHDLNCIISDSTEIKLYAKSVEIIDKEIYFSGKLFIDEIKFSAEVDSSSVKYNGNGSFSFCKKLINVCFELYGWKISGDLSSYDSEIFSFENCFISYFDDKISIGNLRLDNSYYAKNDVVSYPNSEITIFGKKQIVSKIYFTEKGLYADIFFRFPSYISNDGILFQDVLLESNGDIFCDKIYDEYYIKNDKLNILGKGYAISNAGIFVSQLDVTSDYSSDIALTFYNVLIHGETIEVKNFKSKELYLFNSVFIFKEAKLSEAGISFSGKMILSENCPGLLSKRTIELRNFNYSWDGHITEIYAFSNVNIQIPLMDNWIFSCNEISFVANKETSYIGFGEVMLKFPPSFFVGSVNVSGLTYNLDENVFNFESITGSLDSDFALFGIIFKLSKLYIDSDFNVGFEGSCIFVNENFPPFLRNVSSSESRLLFNSSGRLIELNVCIEGLNGNVLPGVNYLDVENGSVCLSYCDESILADLNGNLAFNENASQCLQGLQLNINSFQFDLKTMSLVNLDATLVKDSLDFYGIELTELSTQILWNSSSEKKVFFNGSMVLPSSLPKGIAGQKILIKDFVVDVDGKISSFSIKDSLVGEYDLFDAIGISDCLVDVSYSEKESLLIGLGCLLTLKKDKFPSGIGGTSADMRIYFDSSSIVSFDGSIDIPDCNLFDCFETKDLSSRIIKMDDSWIIDLHGGIHFLPNEKLPEELRTASLNVNSFKISTNGNVVDFNVDGYCDSFSMFDSVMIEEPLLNVKYNNCDFNISFSGSCTITSKLLPDVFSGLNVNIRNLVFSTSKGLVEFDCSINNSICFNVLEKLELVVDSISLSNSGLSFSSIARMNFPGVMENVEIKISEFVFDWNGKIKSIDGGLGYCCIEIGGFSGTIDNLQFKKDNTSEDGFIISLDHCMLRLPENMGGFFVAINNSYFKNGKFHGEFLIPTICCDIAGFKLSLNGSNLNLEKKSIEFETAILTCPDILNFASITLVGVTVSSSHGLKFDGASIILPDFKVGEIGFSRIQASFVLNGKSFYVHGSGMAVIPNAGEIEAVLSFTEKNKDHPIGLERAYFSFEVSVASRGIPIGNTGLYFTGIRGGLAYGKPNEVPMPSQLFFGNGIRMQLGVSVKDFTGGKIVEIKPDLWIDIKNLTFAMQGEMRVLKGIFNIKAESACVLSRFGLYTNMSFSIFIVKGNVSFFIFNGYNGVKFTGKTNFYVGIPKGFIFSWTLNLFFKKIHFRIPTCDCWPFSINAEFGDFANGKRGFKTSIDFPVVGDIGIFVSSAFGLHAGRLSSYDLLSPLGNGLFNISSSSLLFDNNTLSCFTETGGEMLETNEVYFERNENSKRFIVLCAALEGEPELVVISPNGRKFSSATETSNVWYSDNLCAMSIESEEKGLWNYQIENVDSSLCAVKIIEVGYDEKITDLSVIHTDNKIKVMGKSSACDKEIAVSAVNDEGFSTVLDIIPVDSNGLFSSEVNTNILHEGSYEVFAEILYPDSYDFSERKYFGEKIFISKNNIELFRVDNLRLCEDKSCNSITCRWDNPNYANSYGFKFEYEMADGQIHNFNIGNVNEYTLYGFSMEDLRYVKVIPYDKNNSLGPENKLEIKDYVIQANDFSIVNPDAVRVFQNSYATLPLEIIESSDGYSEYFTGKCITEQIGFTVVPENDARIEDGKAILKFNFYVDGCVSPGTYEMELFVWNQKSYDKGKSIMINVIVEKEKLELVRVFPDEIISGEKNRVRVYSKGHGLDSSYYFDGENVIPEVDIENENILVFDLISENTGTVSLSAENLNGDKSEILLNVVNPTYEIFTRLKSLSLSAGSFSYYPLYIARHEGYEKTVVLEELLVQKNLFRLEYYPTDGDLIEVKIFCSEITDSGEYTITLKSDNGQVIELPVVVTNKKSSMPEISQIIPYSCFEGDKVSVYGSCFDENTIVKFSGRDIIPEKISGNKIEFIVPENSETGVLFLSNKNGESNKTKLIVKKRSVDFQVDCKNVILDSYGMVCVKGILSGTSALLENTRINFDHNADDLNVSISRESLNQFMIYISSGNKIRNGHYVLNLTCEAGRFSKSVSININVNCAISIDGEFADGYVGQYYSQCLVCNNSSGNEIFSCDIDPKTGLRMSSSGILYGVPLRGGLITFYVTCVDELNHYACEKKSIFIQQSSWTHEKMSSRNNKFISSDLPSNVDQITSSDAGYEISYILGKDGNVVCVGKNNITVFSEDLKNTFWKKKFDSEITEAKIIGDQICILLDNSSLVMYSLVSGNETMTWDMVKSFSCNEKYLILFHEDVMKVYDVQKKSFSRLLSDYGTIPEKTVWCGNEVFGIRENFVYSILSDAKKFSCDSKILFSVSHGDFVFILTKNYIYRIDSELHVFCKTKINLEKVHDICVDDKYLYVIHSKGLLKLQNDSLDIEADIYNDQFSITGLVLGKEKAVVLQNDEINVCLKSMICKKNIWNHKVSSSYVCCFVDNTIYFSNGHKIMSINGKNNIYEPVIEFTVPNDFVFSSYRPENFISFRDEDSESATIYVSLNMEKFKPLSEIILIDGRNHIEAYGIDSKGLAGPVSSIDVYCNVKKGGMNNE